MVFTPLLLMCWLDDAGGAGDGDHRGLGFGSDFQHRQRGRGDRGTDQQIDLVFRDQLARILHGLGRVRRVVEHDVLDLLAGDLGREQRHRVLFRDAERGGRAGGRDRDADLDLGVGGRGGAEGSQRGDGEGGLAQGNEAVHGVSFVVGYAAGTNRSMAQQKQKMSVSQQFSHII
jgi:hypothetical protein